MTNLLEACETFADWLFLNIVSIAVLVACAGFIIASYEDEVAERQMDCINQSGSWDAAAGVCHVPHHRHPRLGR